MRAPAAVGLATGLTVAACGLPDTGPIALDDRFEAAAGATLILDVLANDRPPAGEQLVLREVIGGRGEIVIVDGHVLRYRAPESTDTFSYRATADDGSSVRADVVVVVGPGTTETTTTTATTTTTTTTSTTTTSTATSVLRPPSIEQAPLDFGTVAAGAVARRSVTAVAGDEPWSPDWSAVGTGSAADLAVDGTCGPLAPFERCTVELVWTATSDLDTTLRPRDDVPFRVHGTVAPIELDPDRQTVRAEIEDGAIVEATFGVVAPSDDPVDIAVEVARAPAGTEIVRGCRLLRGRCDVVVQIPVETLDTGDNPPVIVVVTSPVDVLEARIDVAGEPAPPEWLVPTARDEPWVGLLGLGLGVELAPVGGADGYEIDAVLCADDDCDIELLTDQLEMTEFVVVAPNDFDVERWHAAVVADGSEPRLRLEAVSLAGDLTSVPSTIEVPLAGEPFTARWVSFDPPEPPSSCATVTATISIDSHVLERASIVARFSGDAPGDGDEESSTPFEVPPGSDTVEVAVLLDFELTTIDLVPADPGYPEVRVTDVPEYPARSCID